MPFYDYECKDCKTSIEVKASISEKTAGLTVACPNCGSENTEQAFRSLAFTGATVGQDQPGTIPGVNAACGSACGCFPPN